MADDDKKNDAFSDLGFDSTAFEGLERDFQEVLTELVGDKSLEKFRTEYEKLHRALKKSHESEKRLIKRCRELNAEITTNAGKVQTALKLSQEDQKTISALRKEIEKAWKMVDASHDKEAQANTTINKLKAEIANLQRLVEQGAGLSVGQEHSVKELLKIKEDLTKERNTQAEQIQNLRGEITQLLEKVQRLEADKLELDTEIHSLKESLTSKHDEIDKEQRRKDLLDKDLRDLKAILDSRQLEIKQKQQLIVQGQERIARLELQIKEQRLLTDKALKDYEQLNQRTNKLQQDLEEQVNVNVQLQADKAQRALELKAKQDEIQALEQRELNANRLRSQLMKQKKELEDQLHDVEASKEALKNEIASLERDVEGYKRQAEVEKKQYEDLVRERDLINKNLVRVAEKQQKQVDLIKISESSKKNLEQEIQGYKAQAQKHRKMIYDLEKQREAFIQEASEANQKYLQALEEVKLREMTITDLQKKIAEAEGKLKQQQNLYEAVRSDRNMYSKSLIEAQDEIAEMKRKFKIMGHQIEQLKEEIATKDRALMKEHFEHMKVEKEKDTYKNEQERLKAQIEYMDTTIGSQQAEIQKLNQIINEADAERISQQKEYQRVKNERDILGSQLIRRNDELALLYEKIKIQQSTLTKGEALYHERVEDIRVLKIKIRDQKRELALLAQRVGKVDVLKTEVFELERQLLQERTKVKALSEELENPMNIHRWRKLEGSDPTAVEMVQKIQALQRRLITKTEEVVEKDLKIQERQKQIDELKEKLRRLPGADELKVLEEYKHNLKEKNKQVTALTAELRAAEQHLDETKRELAELQGEMEELKKKYFEQKRKEQFNRSSRSSPMSTNRG